MIIRPVVSGVIRPPVRGYSPGKGGGVPMQVVINGVTYTRLASRSGALLYNRSTGQPLYGRSA